MFRTLTLAFPSLNQSIFQRSLFVGILFFTSACSHMDTSAKEQRWSHYQSIATNSSNAGRYEYNGLGGTGRQGDSLPENGIGGSGRSDLPKLANGLGGTGRMAPDPIENGLGGTGIKSNANPGAKDKTAIFGAISKFGSIWVNDRHIELPEHTEYFMAGQTAQHGDLKLGQMVAVLADSLGESDYQAIEVHMLYSAIGPIDRIETEGNITRLYVLGQTVEVSANTLVQSPEGKDIAVNNLRPQQWIAISGLRTPEQTVQATLILTHAQKIAVLAGPVSAIGNDLQLAEQKIRFQGKTPALAQPLRMQGEIRNGFFIVNEWQPMPHNRILSLADEIWLEGFPLSDAELFMEGFEIQLPEFTDDLFDINDSVRIGIDMDEHEFWMDHEPPEFDDMDERWQPEDMMHHQNDFERHDRYEPEQYEPEFYQPDFDDQPEFDDFPEDDWRPEPPDFDHHPHH